MKIGDKIKFEEEKQRYTIRAISDRYAICTKPMNALKTVLYTVVDFKEKVRGTENLIFGFGAETDEQWKEMLERLTQGESEVSYRNRIKLNIEKIKLNILYPLPKDFEVINKYIKMTPIINPTKEQKWINYIKEYCYGGDTERQHIEADKALTLFLLELGYKDLVDEYENVKKWYA